MLQAANTDLFNPLVPRAHNSESTISFTNQGGKGQFNPLVPKRYLCTPI